MTLTHILKFYSKPTMLLSRKSFKFPLNIYFAFLSTKKISYILHWPSKKIYLNKPTKLWSVLLNRGFSHIRNYNWYLIWSSRIQHTLSAPMVNLVHSRYMVSQAEMVGKTSQAIPAFHMLHAPFKPVHFNGNVGTTYNRGSSKGRVGRWREYSKLVLAQNALKLKTHAPSR